MGTNNSKPNSKANGNVNRKQRTVSTSSSLASYKTRNSTLPAFLRCVSDNEKKKKKANAPYVNKPFQIKKTPFDDDYIFTHSKLGSGVTSRSGGGVYLCLSRADHQTKFAVKKVKNTREARQEAYLQHKAAQKSDKIVRVIDVYANDKWLYIVLEYMRGGELLDRITKRENPYSEKEVAKIMIQLFEGVKHLHSMRIAHRDLKPENILLLDRSHDDMVLKICDFGFAKSLSDGDLVTPNKFTANYASPEVILSSKEPDLFKKYDLKCDIFPLGVIMYILCCGYPPFYSRHFHSSKPSTEKKVLSNDFSFDREEWKTISKEAKDLIRKMLETDPNKRFSVDQILESDWVKNHQKASEAPLKSLATLTKMKNDKILWRSYVNDLETVLNEFRVDSGVKLKGENEMNNPLLKRRQNQNQERSPSPGPERPRLQVVEPKVTKSVDSSPVLRREPNSRKANPTNSMIEFKSKSSPAVDDLKESEEDVSFKKRIRSLVVVNKDKENDSSRNSNETSRSGKTRSLLVALHYSVNLDESKTDDEGDLLLKL